MVTIVLGIFCIVSLVLFLERSEAFRKNEAGIMPLLVCAGLVIVMIIALVLTGIHYSGTTSNNSSDIKQQIEQPKEENQDVACNPSHTEEQTEPNDESEKAFHDINVGKTEGKLFVFYRTDCEPCRKEFYKLVELSKDENTYVCMTRSVYGKLVKDIVGVKYVPSAYRKIGDVWTLVDLD